jgi:hypothetical protein
MNLVLIHYGVYFVTNIPYVARSRTQPVSIL